MSTSAHWRDAIEFTSEGDDLYTRMIDACEGYGSDSDSDSDDDDAVPHQSSADYDDALPVPEPSPTCCLPELRPQVWRVILRTRLSLKAPLRMLVHSPTDAISRNRYNACHRHSITALQHSHSSPSRSHSHIHKLDWVQFLSAGVLGFCTMVQANYREIPALNFTIHIQIVTRVSGGDYLVCSIHKLLETTSSSHCKAS
jgi:hypothetical protein